jgi:trigger factor
MDPESHDQNDFPSLPETDDLSSPADAEGEAAVTETPTTENGEETPKEKLTLQVDVQSPSTCERHITVTIPREDIERYTEREVAKLAVDVQVPGFRKGHVPRKLVGMRFRKEVSEQVKTNLLMDSIGQVSEEQELAAISEPDLKMDAIEVPDEGPMTYEFNLEVRPEFDVPEWHGLAIDRPVRTFGDADVETALRNLLAHHGQLVPVHGPAAAGDYISTSLTFTHDGQTLSSAPEELIRIRPVLSFRDGRIEQFDELMKGVQAGETRVGEALLTEDAPNEALRGQKVTATFVVQEVKKLELPELTPEFLHSLGDFQSEAELRDTIRENLERQLSYEQHRRARDQIARALTVAATWDLPPGLLQRQAERELERAKMELRRAGFSDDDIRARENELRQHGARSTARALKEHFILERIAESEKIEAEEKDYDDEIRLIAYQSGDTARRVRARLEKSGQMDMLRNQIIERKVIDRILEHATFKDVPYEPNATQAEAIDRAAGGGDLEPAIPEAE